MLPQEEIEPVLERIIAKRLNIQQTEELIKEILDKAAAPKRITKRMFSDVKIFLNTINHAVDTMQKAGIKADIRRKDNGESYIYLIEIPKNAMYKFADKKDG